MKGFLDRHKLLTDIGITVLICIVMLTVLEIRAPYFFLQDDNAVSYICQYVYSIRSVLHGEFPFYNFHQLGGISFLDKGQTGQLNIFVYIGALLSKVFLGHLGGVIDFTSAVYLTGGAAGMLLFLQKDLKVQRFIGIIGAVTWSFNTFSVYVGSNWMIVIIFTGCMPWVLHATYYLIGHKGIKALILAAVPKVLLFYGGQPQYFLYTVIFDFIFALTYVLVFSSKGTKLKTSGRFIFKYFLSGLLVTLWSLPLLVPMYKCMKYSADRSGALYIEEFTRGLYDFTNFMMSLFYPFMQSPFVTALDENGQFDRIADPFIAAQANLAHIGYIMFFGAVLGIAYVLLGLLKRVEKPLMRSVRTLYCLIPVMVITFLWAVSVKFNMILYYIPMINRFRYPFKVMQFFIFFLICFGCIGLDIMTAKMNGGTRRKGNIVSAVMIVLTVINLACVYTLLGSQVLGTYTDSPVPYEEPYEDELSGQRYLTVLTHPAFWNFDDDNEDGYRRISRDTAALLGNNYATYYGLDNISGYDVMWRAESFEANWNMIWHFQDVCGSVNDVYDGMVEDMRARAVSFYVTLPEYSDYVEQKLQPYGITRWAGDEGRVIFYDPEAEPRAYSLSPQNDAPGHVELEEHVNYLTVTTPEDFEGGSVTVNFTHDGRFAGTVDGEEYTITDSGDCHDMIIEGVPAGSHEIVFAFEDHTFMYCLIISAAGTIILAAAAYFMKRKKGTEQTDAPA